MSGKNFIAKEVATITKEVATITKEVATITKEVVTITKETTIILLDDGGDLLGDEYENAPLAALDQLE